MADSGLNAAEVMEGFAEVRSDITDLSDKVEALEHGLDLKIQDVGDGVNGVRDAVLASQPDSVDYTATLQQVGQLIAVTDLLLVILTSFIFIAIGLFAGYQVTRWLKNAS